MLLVSVGASALASGLMRALLALCLLLTVVNGCSRQAPVNDRADVEKAIQDYVNSRPILSPSAMSMEVEQVTFHKHEVGRSWFLCVVVRHESVPPFSDGTVVPVYHSLSSASHRRNAILAFR